MLIRAAVLAIAIALALEACGPTRPPTAAPPQPDPTLEPLRAALQAYIELTQPFRKHAAQVAESVPGNDEQKWLADCEAGRPRAITTR